VRRLGVPVLVGDIRLPETLEVLHVRRARSVVAAPAFTAAMAGEHVLATVAAGEQVLAVTRLRVAPGCQAEGRTVGELELAAGSRSCSSPMPRAPAGAPSRARSCAAAPSWSGSSPAASSAGSSPGPAPAPTPAASSARDHQLPADRASWERLPGPISRRGGAAGVRIESSVTSVSWIPREAIDGMVRLPFELGMAHYDLPPPDHLDDMGGLLERSAVRFANELYLLFDGVLAVEQDDQQVAEVGPGAILGEMAVLEGGRRRATLRAVTRCRVAAVPGDRVDRAALAEVARGRRDGG
jgi:hypothetical protein